MGRTRAILLAFLGGASLAGAGAALVGRSDDAPARAELDRGEVAFRLLGVGVDGMSLVLSPDATFAACEYPVASTVRADGALQVQVRRRWTRCPTDGAAVARHYSAVTAQVGTTQLGSELALPIQKRSTYKGLGSSLDVLGVLPNVVGLRIPQACALLRANGIKHVTVAGPVGAVKEGRTISAEDPPGWSDLRPWKTRSDEVRRQTSSPTRPREVRLAVDSNPIDATFRARCSAHGLEALEHGADGV